MSVAAAGQLAGNILSAGDSDFETGIGTWVSNANASSIAQTGAAAFTGAHSLTWTATTTAVSSVTTGGYPVTGGAPYVASCWVESGNPLMMDININWFNGVTFLSTSNGTAVSVGVNQWTPLTLSGKAPATANGATVFVQANSPTAGFVFYLDTVYFAASVWQILAAWPSNPLSTAPLYADMTPWVRADQGITYTRGRADETSTVQAGSCSFTLDNSVPGGWFSPGNATSPFTTALTGGAVQVGKRVQLNGADETGTWHTRCTNYVTSITPGWSGGPGLESTVQVQAQDLLAWLARDNELRTMVEEEQLYDGPMVQYTFGDQSASTTASDSSGNAAAPLRQRKYPKSGSPGAIAFGASSGIVGALAPGFTSSALSAVQFTPSATTGGDIQLEGYLPAPVSAAAGFSAEISYLVVGSAFGANSITPFTLTNSRTGASIGFAYATAVGGSYLFYQPSPSGTLSTSGGATLPATGHAVITVSGTTMTLYINGSSVQTLTVPAGFTADYVTAGGPWLGPFGTIAMSGFPIGWFGQLNCFAVYPAVLSGGRITAHYTAALQQNYGQLISTLIGNILRYAGIPSALQTLDTGASYGDAYEINGQTPLSMIQLYQQVDGGVFYVNAAGLLAWQDRTARYAAQVTPALTLAAGQYQEDLTFPVSTQFLVDDATYANNNIPGGVRALNAPAVAANGTYPTGDPQSPTTGPYYSYPWFWPANPAGQIANPDVLTDAVNWEVGIYGNPVPRSPNVTVELASQPGGGTNVSRAACYGCDVGGVIQLNGLPGSGPGGTRVNYLMTEGVTETFQRNDSGVTWTIQFNTSPASYSAAWIAGDANMGVLDSTAVVGRGTDGSPTGGSPATYIGAPYPVPAFSSGLNVTGNVGANDMRGLAFNVQQAVTPPVAFAQQVSLAQSVNNNTSTDVQWDNLLHDTAGGFVLGTSATTYNVRVPGVYLLMATVAWPIGSAGNRDAWFQRNGTVVNAAAQEPFAGQTPDGTYIEAQVNCATNDTLKVTCTQSSGGALTLSTANGGCTFSILWLGN